MDRIDPPIEVLDPLGKGLEYYTSSTINRRKREYRLKIAKQKGNHSKKDWLDMKEFFENTCCRCHGRSGVIHIEKDHIIPIYLGGSNGIDNIQPLCAFCNTSKGPECIDYRPSLINLLGKELPKQYILLHG